MLDAVVAKANYQTYNEGDHVEYGLKVLRGHPDRNDEFFDSKTPITALNAIPRFVADHLDPTAVAPDTIALLQDPRLARIASILALLLLNVLVFQWAYELYGPAAGVAASLMVIASPNLMAHGTLAATDGYFALAIVGSLYVFRRYLLHPTLANAALSGFALALAQIAKPFALYLYLVVGVSLLASLLIKAPTAPRLSLAGITMYGALSAVLALAVLNCAYVFDRTFTPLSAYRFESGPMVHLQQVVQHWPVLRAIRVPTPYPFLQGLDMMKLHEATGSTFGNAYLLGHVRSVADSSFHGFKSYYAVALFFKEPIALQILFVLGLIWIWRNRSWREIVQGEGPLLLAAGMLVLLASFADRAQVGIRHILPALAIGVIIAAAAFSRFGALSRLEKAGLVLAVLWLALSSASYFPQMIPYMNEWVPDRRLAYKILGDSNLDYGQDTYLVNAFLKKNPDVAHDPLTPTCGRVLISINHLVGIVPIGPPKPLIWALRERPVAHVGHGHLLYVIPASTCSNGVQADRIPVNEQPSRPPQSQ